MNESLLAEAVRLLVNGSASSLAADNGIPAPVIGRALEGPMVRERLSPWALEILLQPELFSPHYVYPADAEILHDVILFLLRRKWASPSCVPPAELLCLAPDSLLPANYGEAINHAVAPASNRGGESGLSGPPAALTAALSISDGAEPHLTNPPIITRPSIFRRETGRRATATRCSVAGVES